VPVLGAGEDCRPIRAVVVRLAGFGQTKSLHDGIGEPFAAPAGKGECVEKDGTDAFIELPAQQIPGTMQPRSHGFGF
jgi:hypothetical protein